MRGILRLIRDDVFFLQEGNGRKVVGERPELMRIRTGIGRSGVDNMVSGHRHSTIVETAIATDELPVARGGESPCPDSRSARQVFPCSFPHP